MACRGILQHAGHGSSERLGALQKVSGSENVTTRLHPDAGERAARRPHAREAAARGARACTSVRGRVCTCVRGRFCTCSCSGPDGGQQEKAVSGAKELLQKPVQRVLREMSKGGVRAMRWKSCGCVLEL